MAKVLISMDDHLLERLDNEARRRGVTRSKLVTELTTKELGPEKGPGDAPEVHEAMARLRELFRTAPYADKRDSTEIIREMRDSR